MRVAKVEANDHSMYMLLPRLITFAFPSKRAPEPLELDRLRQDWRRSMAQFRCFLGTRSIHVPSFRCLHAHTAKNKDYSQEPATKGGVEAERKLNTSKTMGLFSTGHDQMLIFLTNL